MLKLTNKPAFAIAEEGLDWDLDVPVEEEPRAPELAAAAGAPARRHRLTVAPRWLAVATATALAGGAAVAAALVQRPHTEAAERVPARTAAARSPSASAVAIEPASATPRATTPDPGARHRRRRRHAAATSDRAAKPRAAQRTARTPKRAAAAAPPIASAPRSPAAAPSTASVEFGIER